MALDCVLWDHDGVLVDTEPVFYEATVRALARYGVALDLEEWAALQAAGRGLVLVVEEAGHADRIGEIRTVRDDIYAELLADGDVMIRGAREALERAAGRYRMAMVTTSLRRFVDQMHGDTGLLDLFDHVVTAEDCERHKPHPEPYQKAMRLLGATPDRCVAVEDSPRGMKAAIAAEVPCIVVRSAFMFGASFPGAHSILDDIGQLPETLNRMGAADRDAAPGA